MSNYTEHARLTCGDLVINDNDKVNNNSLEAFYMALGINGAQVLILLLVFLCINKANGGHKALAPRRRHEDDEGISIQATISEALKADSSEKVDIDGHVAIRFCQLGLKFSALGTVLACVLIPWYRSVGDNEKGTLSISISNLAPENDKPRYAAMVSVLVLTVYFLYLMRLEWLHMISMKREHFMRRAAGEFGPAAAQAQWSLILERVPSAARSPQHIIRFFTSVFEGVHSCVVQPDAYAVIERKRAKCLAKYCCCCCRRRAETAFLSVVDAERTVVRKVATTVEKGKLRMDNLGTAPSDPTDVIMMPRDGGETQELSSTAFLTMNSVAQRLIADDMSIFTTKRSPPMPSKRRRPGHDPSLGALRGDYDDWEVQAAPEARDIVWKNVSTPLQSIQFASMIGNVVCIFGVLLWAIPVAAVQALVSPKNLQTHVPGVVKFLEDWKLYTLVTGYLPVLMLTLLLAVLPYILHALSETFERVKTKSRIEFKVMTRNLAFQMATLYVACFSSTLMETFSQLVESPSCAAYILGNSFPKVSAYFTNFVVVRIGTSLPLLLLRPMPLLSWLRGKTDEEPEPEYIVYGMQLVDAAMVFLIGTMYCVVAPIIMPVCLIYFGLATVTYRWLFLNVYEPEFDAGGDFWYALFTGVMIGMILGLLTFVGVVALLGVSDSSFEWFFAFIPPVMVLLCLINWNISYKQLSRTMTYEDAVGVDRDVGAEVRGMFRADLYENPMHADAESSDRSDYEDDDDDDDDSDL